MIPHATHAARLVAESSWLPVSDTQGAAILTAIVLVADFCLLVRHLRAHPPRWVDRWVIASYLRNINDEHRQLIEEVDQ